MSASPDAPLSPATTGGALRVVLRGSGPVALAFALFADRLMGPELSIALPALPEEPIAPALAARPLAISQGTRLLLERVMRFPDEAAPIQGIDIALAGLPGRTRLAAADLELPALGWVVRYGRLWEALREAARTRGLVEASGSAADDSGSAGGAGSVAALHESVEVVADGDPGEDARVRLDGEAAVLAEVIPERGVQGAAIERFTRHGPLALLPLPVVPRTPARWALVWCSDEALAAQRADLPQPAFEDVLERAAGEIFGRLHLVESPQCVPLASRARRELVQGHTVWIGNAAQALHPVAGQGLNLGMRDAYELAESLARGHQRGLTAALALAEYARRRSADRGSMLRVTDLLATALRAPLGRPLQSVALAVLDVTPTLRNAVARGFMHGFVRT